MFDKMNRRSFLKGAAMSAAGLLAASCAQPTPETIIKEVPVEKIVKETVVVEKEVAVEKIVKETVIVEKEVPIEKVVVATAQTVSQYREAPMLAEMVAAGELPPVEERLPEDPLVMDVVEEIGEYGGTWRRAYKGISDRWGPMKVASERLLEWRMPEGGAISIQNHFAAKYEQNSDATEFTWYLRKGCKWSDGAPITTEDARFWYEDIFMNEEVTPNPEANLSVGGEPMTMDIIDDYTFKTTFAAPNPLLPLFISVGAGMFTGNRGPNFLSPAHYYKKLHGSYVSGSELQAVLDKWEAATWPELFQGQHPATFPFQNKEVPVIWAWATEIEPPADRISMKRNPYFWAVDPAGNQLPYIDYITHDLFDNIEVLNFMILNGDIDCQNRHVSSANYTVFRENEDKGDYRLIIWKDAQTYAYHFNMSWDADPVLAEIYGDQRFRDAVSLCIDREEVNDLVFDGTLEPRQHSPVSGSPEYNAEMEQYLTEYDPDAANTLLDDMGLTERDGDGIRLRPDGEPLTLTVTYALASFAGSDDMHLLLQEYLEAIGVKVLLDGIERSLHEDRASANELMIHSWVTDRSAVVKADINWYMGSANEAWGLWRDTNGAEGVEPPDTEAGRLQKKLWDLWDSARIDPNETSRNEKVNELIELNIKAMWNVGVCGEAPALFVTKNNFRNVPEGLVQDDPLRAIGLGQPMQFFFKS